MKKIAIIFGFLVSTSALFSQVISANFEHDAQGWTSHQSVEWSRLLPPMDHRNGMHFSGEITDGDRILYLYIQKEVENLKPNTNYRIRFNMNWVCWMEISASPIWIEIGAAKNQELAGFDFVSVGSLMPNELGHPFLQNINNFEKPYQVNTDDDGRLFLWIRTTALPLEGEKIEHIFLNTVRVLLHENGKTREVPNDDETVSVLVIPTQHSPEDEFEISIEEVSEIVFEETDLITLVPSHTENDLVLFKSNFNDEIKMVNIYTEDNHLIKIVGFRDFSVDEGFRTTGLISGTYRIEFVLSDGRILNKFHHIE
jgi:hypothetical protein